MKELIPLLLAMLAGCTTNHIYVSGDANTINVGKSTDLAAEAVIPGI